MHVCTFGFTSYYSNSIQSMGHWAENVNSACSAPSPGERATECIGVQLATATTMWALPSTHKGSYTVYTLRKACTWRVCVCVHLCVEGRLGLVVTCAVDPHNSLDDMQHPRGLSINSKCGVIHETQVVHLPSPSEKRMITFFCPMIQSNNDNPICMFVFAAIKLPGKSAG